MASRPQSRAKRASPKPNSAKPRKLTASSPTRRSAPPTIVTATPAFQPVWATRRIQLHHLRGVSGYLRRLLRIRGCLWTRRRRAAARVCSAGPICATTCSLSFEEAAAGVTTKIRLPRQEFCDACNGTGAKAGTGVVACETCSGRGQLHYQQGFFSIIAHLPACQGAGQMIREKCPDCRGRGRVERTRTIDVRIPPGVDSQTRMRVPSEGEPGANGGAPGRSLHRARREGTSVFRAARRRSLLHHSRQHHAGRAWAPNSASPA